MSVKYEIIEETHGYSYIQRTKEDGTISFIPMDESNSDYREYLEHLTENPTEDVE